MSSLFGSFSGSSDVWMFLELKFSIKADLIFLHFRWHGVHHKKWVACQGLPFYGWFCASILSLSPFLQVQTYEETLEVLPTQSFASLIKEQTTLTLQMLALRSGVPWRRLVSPIVAVGVKRLQGRLGCGCGVVLFCTPTYWKEWVSILQITALFAVHRLMSAGLRRENCENQLFCFSWPPKTWEHMAIPAISLHSKCLWIKVVIQPSGIHQKTFGFLTRCFGGLHVVNVAFWICRLLGHLCKSREVKMHPDLPQSPVLEKMKP